MRALHVERLEPRVLLAATITTKGRNLIIESDGDGDDIMIIGAGAGAVRVGINGGPLEDFEGGKNIIVIGNGGDDTLLLNGVDIPGKVVFDAGEGDDRLVVGGGFTAKRLQFLGGAGNDEAVYNEVEFNAKVDFRFGDGDDTVLEGSGATFNDRLKIDMGAGADFLNHSSLNGGNVYAGKVTVKLGKGDDMYFEQLGNFQSGFSVNGGSGQDHFDDDVNPNTFAKTPKFKNVETGAPV